MALLNSYSHGVTIQPTVYVYFLLMTVAAMIFSGCSIQNSLLYFPNPDLPKEETLKAAQLKTWPAPSSTADYRGLISNLEGKYEKGTIVVFHGNGGTAANRVLYVKTFATLGYRVILAEYPRYGGRKGDLGEKAFVSDALETVKLAFAQFGEPLFLLGESLGCGVATGVANNPPVKIEGIVLVTPWDTLTAISQSKFPLLPVRLFLTDTYDNINNLKSFQGRISVVAAERDKVVPVSHANNLYRALTNPTKRMWLIEKAGHNDVLFYIDPTKWKEIMDFVRDGGKE